MKQHSSGLIIGLVVAIVLGFGIVALVAFGFGSASGLGYEPPVLQATKTGPNAATLNISTFPDSQVCHPGAPNPQITWVTYCSGTNNDHGTTWELPANSTITVIIKQYDSASGLYNDFFQDVQGTIGGTAIYNGKTGTTDDNGQTQTMTYNGPESRIPAEQIAHTFTIQSQPDDTTAPLFVSVPLLGVADDAASNTNVLGNDGNQYQYPAPNTIQFQFRTGPAGHTYIWHCYVPCGNDRETPYGFTGPMSTTGFMAGTITVTNY
ncbi:MAG TPA: hypothetical protein VJ761_00550 [Ktedonobacteraceae bacterium]|nr:hypothetical protein [Ktedonobacteraceae bacterium]